MNKLIMNLNEALSTKIKKYDSFSVTYHELKTRLFRFEKMLRRNDRIRDVSFKRNRDDEKNFNLRFDSSKDKSKNKNKENNDFKSNNEFEEQNRSDNRDRKRDRGERDENRGNRNDRSNTSIIELNNDIINSETQKIRKKRTEQNSCFKCDNKKH